MDTKVPAWHWIISGLLLIWNLLGVGAFIMQMRATPEQILRDYGQVQADIIAAQPAWYPIIFGLAVFGGAVGCLGLLLRKKWANQLLLISLIAVIIQNIYFATAGVFEHTHGGQWSMIILIPLIAIFLVWYARKMTVRGILK